MYPIRICTVVTGKTIDEFVKNLDDIQKISDLVELRVDYIEELKLNDIQAIKTKIIKPSIFTCRKKDEGGMFNQSEEKRIEILNKAFDLAFDYIDVEYLTLQKQSFDKHEHTKLIVSNHNFDETPPYWQLTKLIFDMSHCKADIIKIATTVKKDYDVQVLFRALLSKKPNDNQIILGMGEKGKITRVLGPLLGSYLTYASTAQTQSAPGQINIDELQSIYHSFQIKNIF